MTGQVSFGVAMPSVGEFAAPAVTADLVQLAEALGYADVWYGDHVAVPSYAAHLVSKDWIEPLAACFIALGRTSRLRVGTDVLVLPYRHPLLVAKMAATAQHLSGGRLIIGGGVGYLRGEFAALDAPYEERGRASDEALEIFDALWSSGGDAVSHGGEFWSFDDVRFGPDPAAGRVPVWVGGNAPAALRRAARFGDGWHPLFPTPEQYAVARATILDQRADLGRAGEFTFSFSCAATELVASARDEYETHVWTDVPDDFTYAPPAPATADGRPRFVGSPDDVAADIAAYSAAGVDHFTLRFANGGPEVDVDQLMGQMREFAAEVAPRFA
jgi:probable F420-dependent oxidoreductase